MNIAHRFDRPLFPHAHKVTSPKPRPRGGRPRARTRPDVGRRARRPRRRDPRAAGTSHKVYSYGAYIMFYISPYTVYRSHKTRRYIHQ